ncbi:hypothetical protein [Pleurocapsa sp. FMAR1]|uniref:hypothetical protein n=1 Tax=Pleurocapsa sp. FMAR1 TaxID=3040204 RepID=UPI0029C7077B|nr:hypothetical protein [Pleurocapsa sp. FMAR1]
MKILLTVLSLISLGLVSCGHKKITNKDVILAKENLEVAQSLVEGSLFTPQTLKPGYLKKSEKLLALYEENDCYIDSLGGFEKIHENVDCQKLVPQMVKADKELWNISKKYHNEKNICNNHLDTIGVKTKKECKTYLKQKEEGMKEGLNKTD